MKRSLVSGIVANVLLLCENNDTPKDWEWDECLSLLAELKAKSDLAGEPIRVLVSTLGGGPNAAQRKRLEGVIGSSATPTAVVSNSLKLRFISAAIALFNADHRAFTVAERLEAYKHLRLNTTQTRALEAAIGQMSKLVTEEAKH
ncbi:MAG: hypothetical protein ABI548_30290 [Polyangiaceae bacterium]